MCTASATRRPKNSGRLLPDFGRFWKLLPETPRSHPGWSCRHSDHIPRQICQRLLVNYTTCHWVAMDSAVSFPYLSNTKIASISETGISRQQSCHSLLGIKNEKNKRVPRQPRVTITLLTITRENNFKSVLCLFIYEFFKTQRKCYINFKNSTYRPLS